MESVLADVSRELGTEAVIGKVHENERALFKRYGVRGIPTILVVRDGEVKEKFVGGRPKAVLVNELRKHGS